MSVIIQFLNMSQVASYKSCQTEKIMVYIYQVMNNIFTEWDHHSSKGAAPNDLQSAINKLTNMDHEFMEHVAEPIFTKFFEGNVSLGRRPSSRSWPLVPWQRYTQRRVYNIMKKMGVPSGMGY